MKKVLFCNLIALALVTMAVKVNAQAPPNYFVGKWSVLLKGLPQGDARLKFNIADSVGHLKGVMIDTTSNTETPLTNIEQENDKVTLYFTAQGYDVNLVLNKKDDDHATGSLMGMFDAVADRIKP
ncbi:hypothetical protein [Mucilaginibacter sp.]|jgi:hypothetical protein|uniref:hypothetical protein n=1 Tax=Mucilaginibacter sp. TaxID=1882438 RepID=UPI002CA2C7E4|nr:hypothetical protein [Mucilaginibacter sp.]HTI60078.1 hypothetical protein [Mucilaginibacter sp.]